MPLQYRYAILFPWNVPSPARSPSKCLHTLQQATSLLLPSEVVPGFPKNTEVLTLLCGVMLKIFHKWNKQTEATEMDSAMGEQHISPGAIDSPL
jgi:hypothetical protein